VATAVPVGPVLEGGGDRTGASVGAGEGAGVGATVGGADGVTGCGVMGAAV